MGKKVISFDAIDTKAAERAKPPASDQEYIDELADAYTSQCELPPLDVFGEKGAKTYFLADGLRRITAAKKSGLLGLECVVHEGDYEDALLFSAGANNRHGQRPSQADKFKKVRELLLSKRWKGKSDRWIGDTCGVTHGKVKDIRAEIQLAAQPTENGDEKREGRDGKRYKAKRDKSNGTESDEPQAGEEVFDHKAFYAAFNSLLRCTDRMYRIHKLTNSNGSTKRDEDFEAIVRHLDGFMAAFSKRWRYLAGVPLPRQ